MADADVVAEEFAAFEGVDAPISEFVKAFKADPAFARKVAITTGLPQSMLKQLADADLTALFESLDKDCSGTVSFEEFVAGLEEIRKSNREFKEMQDKLKEDAVLEAAVEEAVAAFESADFAHRGELTLEDFIEALTDPRCTMICSQATHLPPEYFEGLSAKQLLSLFREIDTDHSGIISFSEWVECLVRTRLTLYSEQKATEDGAVAEVMKHAEAALEEGDEDFSGEFSIQEFMDSFKYNPRFLRKVSLATGHSIEDFRGIPDKELQDMFYSLDTDSSGTVSFEEFVKGLVQIRLARQEAVAQEEAMEEAYEMEKSFSQLAQAFAEADFKYQGELSINDFMEALCDPVLVERISNASGLDAAWLFSLTTDQMVDMFQEIDTDASGTISFTEWISALMQVKQATYAERKAIEKEETDAVIKLAEEAMDEGDDDFSGEFDLREFVTSFKHNPRFIRKVSQATGLPVDQIKNLTQDDVVELFHYLDKDESGTVSFDEFVKGLVEIRMENKAAKAQEEAMEEQKVLESTIMDAYDAFSEIEGNLDLEGFRKALRNPDVVSRVIAATHVREDFFENLEDWRIKEIFDNMDSDGNGTISFQEWITSMVETRQETYAVEKQQQAEEEEAMEAVKRDAEEALEDADEDWSGEFEPAEFIRAFREHPRFLQKISHATGVAVQDYQSLTDEDLTDLFASLDTNQTGTVSFEEFVRGLAEIRMAKQAGEIPDAILEEEAIADDPQVLEQVKQEVKSVVKENVVAGSRIKVDEFKSLMKSLDSRWDDLKIEKLLAGSPCPDGGSPVSLEAFLDFVFEYRA
eukprot:TRINITY_DN88330_c0_g1_i1.p1 TRINITY_DN88330_c0_g1~~TRINITY_DN88330_c0_g1_i1.p1  ORF type:complete len:809 (-),score=238.24 TRINITY_DN88330_c0_g1_i1:275-2701(-)